MKNSEKTIRANIFGYPVDVMPRKEALNYIMDRIQSKQGGCIVTINPEMIAMADKDPKLAGIIKNAELIIPDSIGIKLALRKTGYPHAEQVPGIEFSEELMGKCAEKNVKVGFIGGEEIITDRLIYEIKQKFPGLNIVFAYHGYFKTDEETKVVSRIRQSEPGLLFVALGVPRQEFFIEKYRTELPDTVMIGVGGSFDVWAKKVKRAPALFRICGLEWLYRLITQPQRAGRMFPVLPLFLIRILFDR